MDKTHEDYVCRKHRGIHLLNYLTVDVDVCVCDYSYIHLIIAMDKDMICLL